MAVSAVYRKVLGITWTCWWSPSRSLSVLCWARRGSSPRQFSRSTTCEVWPERANRQRPANDQSSLASGQPTSLKNISSALHAGKGRFFSRHIHRSSIVSCSGMNALLNSIAWKLKNHQNSAYQPHVILTFDAHSTVWKHWDQSGLWRHWWSRRGILMKKESKAGIR